jgi:hypothetical protein
VTVTAGTTRPVQLRFDEVPGERSLADAMAGVDCWYSDPHGDPDWRRAMSTRFADELRLELGRAATAGAAHGTDAGVRPDREPTHDPRGAAARARTTRPGTTTPGGAR